MTETTSLDVRIFGPNLSGAGQRKGALHVHREGCRDAKTNYGPGKKYGGDDVDGWLIEAKSKADAVFDIYGNQIDEGCPYATARDDVYFAPCVASLPEGCGHDKGRDRYREDCCAECGEKVA